MTTNGPPEPQELGQIRTQMAMAFRDHFRQNLVGGQVQPDTLQKIKDSVTEQLEKLAEHGPLSQITIKETKVVGDEVHFQIEGIPVGNYVHQEITLEPDQLPVVKSDPIQITIPVKNLLRNGAPWKVE